MSFSFYCFPYNCTVLISNQAQPLELNMQNLQSLNSFPLYIIFPSSKLSPSVSLSLPYLILSSFTPPQPVHKPKADVLSYRLPSTASHCRSSSLPCRHLNGWRADPSPLTFPLFLYQREQEPGTKAGFLPPLFPMHCQFIQHRRAFRELHKGMLLKWQCEPKRAPGRAVCATTWGTGTGGAE